MEVEEVKLWKSSIHWTTQTFSSRPRFSLCGAQTPTENLWFSCCDPPWSEETLLTQHTRSERQRMTWSNLYNYLPVELRKTHPHNNVWHDKYKALILRMDTIDFCFQKRFQIDTSHTRRTTCRLPSMEFDQRHGNRCIDTVDVSLVKRKDLNKHMHGQTDRHRAVIQNFDWYINTPQDDRQREISGRPHAAASSWAGNTTSSSIPHVLKELRRWKVAVKHLHPS